MSEIKMGHLGVKDIVYCSEWIFRENRSDQS